MTSCCCPYRKSRSLSRVPLLSFGVASLDAFRLAFRLIMAAIDGVTSASGALQARAIRLDFRLAFVMCPPECAGVPRCSKHDSTILAAKAEQLNETLYASALLAAI